MATPDIIPYSQHYRCYRQMINGTSTQAVLEYIFDEYLARAKRGRSGEFTIKYNQISNNCNLKWETVKTQVEKLERMKLITLDADGACLFHEDIFTNLCYAFIKLSSNKAREEFACALEAGDYEKLASLGYNTLQNRIVLSKNGEGSPISDNIIQNRIDVSKNGYAYPKSDTYSRIFLSKIGEMYPKSDIFDLLFDELSPIFGVEEAQKAIEDIYSGKPLEYNPIYFHILGVLTLEKLSKIGYETIQNRITKINNNKREVTSLSSEEEIEDNQEKEDNMGNSSFPDNNGFEDVELLPAIKINQEAINQTKRKKNLPFLTSSEMDMFTQSPDLVVDRPDALFIFQLWTILKEYFTQEVEDEDGNVSEKQINPDGQYIPVEVFLKNILGPAFEATESAIQTGKLECEKGTFQLSIPQDFQLSVNDMFMIPDFNRVKTDDDDYFQISYDRFHDITAKGTEESGKPEGMRESEYNKRYLQEIVKTEDNEERFRQLTDMEYFVYVFIGQYFKIDDTTKEIIDVLDEYQNRKYVTGRELARYFMEHTEVSKDDFLGILKTPLNEGALDLKPVGLFSADKIRKWNRLHKQKSIIEI